MAVSNIQIQLVNNAEPLLAYAKVPLTLYNKSHIIVELKVLSGERGPWIALPQRKDGDGWVPIISIPEDIWEKVKYAVLLAYNTQRHSQPSSKLQLVISRLMQRNRNNFLLSSFPFPNSSSFNHAVGYPCPTARNV